MRERIRELTRGYLRGNDEVEMKGSNREKDAMKEHKQFYSLRAVLWTGMRRLLKVLLATVMAGTPMVAAARMIVGIGIAKSDDRVFTWYDDRTFTIGSSDFLEMYRHAYPYLPPEGKTPADIVAMSIAASDHVFTWYRDQTVSEGNSAQLAIYAARTPVVLPKGKTMANIVGIGIAASDDWVYVWYDDQTVSIGTPLNFVAHSAPYAYQLPDDPFNPGSKLTPADIVEMDIDKNDWVYTWYRNGLRSAGSSGNLALHSMGPYFKAHVLYHWWGNTATVAKPTGTKPPQAINTTSLIGGVVGGPAKPDPHTKAKPSKKEPGPAPSPAGSEAGSRNTANLQSPAKPGVKGPVASTTPQPHWEESGSFTVVRPPSGPIKPFHGPISGPTTVMISQGNDPMVAVSDKFIVASGVGGLEFADRQGNPLPGGALSDYKPGPMSTNDFFKAFTDPSPDNEVNINRNIGFPGACDQAPNNHNVNLCIADFYDTRVYFDSSSKRFFIIATARNFLWADLSIKNYDGIDGACGKFAPNKQNTIAVYGDDCLWTRRLMAFAVSNTEDPRDGFHQYMVTEDMYADFPWLAVNGKRVVLSHAHSVWEPPQWPVEMPVVQVFDLDGLASGAHHPAYFRYYPEDLDSLRAVIAPPHYADDQGMTFLVAGSDQGGNSLTIFGLPDDPDPWNKPALIERTETFSLNPPLGTFSTYRAGNLYFASPDGQDIRVTRLPVTRSGNDVLTSTSSSDGFLDKSFGSGDPHITFSMPSIAVNASGAMLIGYTANPYQTNTFPQARVTFWPAGASAPHASRLVRMGGAPGAVGVDYTTTVVDPADDNTFWVALPYQVQNGAPLNSVAQIP
jgi:hypothetical protein